MSKGPSSGGANVVAGGVAVGSGESGGAVVTALVVGAALTVPDRGGEVAVVEFAEGLVVGAVAVSSAQAVATIVATMSAEMSRLGPVMVRVYGS